MVGPAGACRKLFSRDVKTVQVMGEKQPFFGLVTSSKGRQARHHQSTIPLVHVYVHPPAEDDEFAAGCSARSSFASINSI